MTEELIRQALEAQGTEVDESYLDEFEMYVDEKSIETGKTSDDITNEAIENGFEDYFEWLGI